MGENDDITYRMGRDVEDGAELRFVQDVQYKQQQGGQR